MEDRSVWWRTGAGVAAWSALAVASALVAWAAVDVVRDSSTGPVPSLTTASQTSLPAASPSSSESPTGSQTAASDRQSTPAPEPVVRTIRSRGGILSVACSGRTARLVYATPSSGWRMQRDDSSGDRVRVEFHRDGTTLKVSGRCRDGGVEADVDEDTSGGGNSGRGGS